MTQTTMPPNLGCDMLDILIQTASTSMNELRARISDVTDAPLQVAIEKNCECIQFMFDGKSYLGELRGRNRYLCIDPVNAQSEMNRAIALRVMLDRNAAPLASASAA